MKLTINGITFFYKSEKVLDSVSFEVKEGELVAVLGKNGAGKSTLLKTIAKILTPTSGEIKLDNIDIFKLKRRDFVKNISYISQKQQENFLTVFDMLLLGRRAYFGFKPSIRDYEIVSKIIKILELESIKLKPTSTLSGGELQKVAIARVLVQESSVILLDEPTNNLDIKNQIEILKFLKSLKKSALIVIHDINLAIRFCDKFIFMKDGKVAYEGNKDIVTAEVIKDIYDIEVDICSYSGLPFIIPK